MVVCYVLCVDVVDVVFVWFGLCLLMLYDACLCGVFVSRLCVCVICVCSLCD